MSTMWGSYCWNDSIKPLNQKAYSCVFFFSELVRSSGDNDSDSSDDYLSESEDDDEDLYRELQRNKKRKQKNKIRRRDGGSPSSRYDDFADDADVNIVCFVQMLDILLEQLETNEVKKHQGIDYFPGPQIASLLQAMLQVSNTRKNNGNWLYWCTRPTFSTIFNRYNSVQLTLPICR